MRQEVRSHQALAEFAAGQHGVISRHQMRELGYSPSAIQRALKGGRLHRVHRGVYAVGHERISVQGLCLAAVLACGRDAVLSHFAAAWLWGLSQPAPKRIDVTVPTRGQARKSFRVHHAPALAETDRTILECIPVTALPRTLLDLAVAATKRSLAGAVERAERLGLLDLDSIDDLLGRCGQHPGRRTLQLALDIYRDPVFSRARSERLFLALIKEGGLPRPALNTFVAGHEVDAYWERERFAVEVDGWGAHRTRAAFERDPLRQEELKLAGIDSIRITARRIEREPLAVARRLALILEQRRRSLDHSHPR